MARAIRHRPSPEALATNASAGRTPRDGSAESLASLAEVVRLLDERGFLRFAADLLREEDRVVEVLVDRVPAKSVRAAWRAAAVLVATMRAVEPATAERIARSLPLGLEEAARSADGPMVGLFDVLHALNDPDVNRGVRMLLGGLRGLGRGAGP